jgi:hypothetical protein
VKAPAEIASGLRKHAQRAARDLAVYERAINHADRFGVYRLAAHEDIDEGELLSYLRRARREHPEQALEITVIAR